MLKTIFRPHRSSLKADTAAAQKIFAMLKLIPQGEVVRSRPTLAFALVIDTSGSMQEFADQERAEALIQQRGLDVQCNNTDGKDRQGVHLTLPTKLDKAIEAGHALLSDERLLAEDRITIIHFDTHAKTLLPLTSFSNRKALADALESLRNFSGSTQMAQGLKRVEEQFTGLPDQIAKRIFLLTDGETTDAPTCRAMAGHFAEMNAPIIALGIGNEYNAELMTGLAEISQGRPYHLRSMSEFHEILEKEVGTSVREVITDLQMSVQTVKGTTVESVTRVYPSLADVSTSLPTYRMGNIPAGDFSVFVLEFAVSGISRPPSRARIAQLSLKGFAPGIGREETFATQELHVNFCSEDSVLAEVDAEVLSYVQQKNVDRMVQDAVRYATVDVGRARQTLQVAAGMTQRVGNAAMTKMLEGALDELNKTGTISDGTRRTVALGGKTKTVRTGSVNDLGDVPSDEVIRKLTGA